MRGIQISGSKQWIKEFIFNDLETKRCFYRFSAIGNLPRGWLKRLN